MDRDLRMCAITTCYASYLVPGNFWCSDDQVNLTAIFLHHDPYPVALFCLSQGEIHQDNTGGQADGTKST